MRADFVANASHELRTPLASLIGFIETLRGPARDDSAARDRFLAIMAEQAQPHDAAGRRSAVALAHRDERASAADGPRRSRAACCAPSPTAWSSAPTRRDMRIALALPPDSAAGAGRCRRACPGVPEPDRQRHQVQRRRNRGRGERRPLVAAGAAGERRRCRSPCAITARASCREHLPRLTERFYRVDPARSRELGGTGLGLAIVKHIVNHHRGVLDIDSELGQGSVFTVHLPMASSYRLTQPGACGVLLIKAQSNCHTVVRESARIEPLQPGAAPPLTHRRSREENRREGSQKTILWLGALALALWRRAPRPAPSRGDFRRRRHLPLSDLRQVGRGLQGEDRHRHELSVDRLGRRHQADQGQDRRLRRLRHAAEARGSRQARPDPVSQ